MRAIDANALIEELNNSHFPGAPYVDAGISIAIGKVCDAPTIEPKPKTGEWILIDNHDGWPDWKCSQCWGSGRGDYHYCPYCGADMREGQDD